MPVAIELRQVCGSSNLIPALDLGEQYLTGTFRRANEGRDITKGGHFLTQLLVGMRYDATGTRRVYRLDKIPQGIFGLVRSRDYSFFNESLKVINPANLPIAQAVVVLAPRIEKHSKMRPSDMARGFTYLFQLGMWSRLPISSLRLSAKNETFHSR